MFRIFASVKQGKFTHDGRKYEQVSTHIYRFGLWTRFENDMTQIAQYFHGIGVKKWYPEKLIDGVSGSGCEELIKDVYQVCRVGASYTLHVLRIQ